LLDCEIGSGIVVGFLGFKAFFVFVFVSFKKKKGLQGKELDVRIIIGIRRKMGCKKNNRG